jgi:hypothetical protein
MTKEQEIQESQTIQLPQEFFECLQHGIIPVVKYSNDKLYFQKMKASVIVQTWNASRFLPMLFESFDKMDRSNIDVKFIIADAGSDEKNKNEIMDILDKYKNKLNILFLYNNYDDKRIEFNNLHPDSNFHSFPYLNNMALQYIDDDEVFILCDSSNIVNDRWLRGLCSLHYIYPDKKLIVRAKGADFSAKSTTEIENKNFDNKFFDMEQTYNHFGGGNGQGISMLGKNIKEIGGYDQINFSCVGGADDQFHYRFLKHFSDKSLFIGNENSYGIHRVHNDGYDKSKGQRPRTPGYAYKLLKKLYIEEKNTSLIIHNEIINPIEIHKNY